MRKISLLRLFHCDVLVFDTIGTGWIHHCLPSGCNVSMLELRHNVPLFLDIPFLFIFLKEALFGERTRCGHLSYAWLAALLERIAPRIIFTCADNNSLLARYSQAHPNVPVIFLQNALRDTAGSIVPGLHLPLYLSLGKVEFDIFNSLKIRCREYRPTGSVKLGLALARVKENHDSDYDLCFISHYRSELFATDAPELFHRIEENQRFLFERLVNYASARELSLAVVLKTREVGLQVAEQKYFTEIAGGMSFSLIRANKGVHELDSYLAGLTSDLIVHPASTLGFELFAAGKKVLFGASADSTLIQQWGIQHYFDTLPNLVKLENNTNDGFIKCCDQIRELPDTLYQEITEVAAATVISMPERGYPHDTIKQLICNLLAR